MSLSEFIVPVLIPNYSIMSMFVNLETYFKKFYFLLDFNNENK